MDRLNRIPAAGKLAEFVVSPYKVSLCAVLVGYYIPENGHCAPNSGGNTPAEIKVNPGPDKCQRQVGRFSRIMIKLIQGLDMTYEHLIAAVHPPNTSQSCFDRFLTNIAQVQSDGLCSLMDLMKDVTLILETGTFIHRSSIVGIFLRKMVLYFDKLSYSGMTILNDEFQRYVNPIKSPGLLRDPAEELDEKWTLGSGAKQFDLVMSQQVQLIGINEKKALSPALMMKMMRRSGAITGNRIEHNQVNFLCYMNFARMGDYSSAIKSLRTYFDFASINIARCWTSLNIAILQIHFGYYDSAIENLREGIRSARELADEKCLQICMLWYARLLMISGQRKDDLMAHLRHIEHKSADLNLQRVCTLTRLYQEHLSGSITPPETNPQSLITCQNESLGEKKRRETSMFLAIQHGLNEVLLDSLANQSAMICAQGWMSTFSLSSQAILHYHITEHIEGQNVLYSGESSLIAVRNLALYAWTSLALFDEARALIDYGSQLIPSHRKEMNLIWKQALAIIQFEHYLFQEDWKSATLALSFISGQDESEGILRNIQLYIAQNDERSARLLIHRLHTLSEKLDAFSLARMKLEQAKLTKSIDQYIECINLCNEKSFYGLTAEAMVYFAQYLALDLERVDEPIRMLNQLMSYLISNGSIELNARAFYTISFTHYRMYEKNKSVTATESNAGEQWSDDLEKASRYNQIAVGHWERLGAKRMLARSFRLQAQIHDERGENGERNEWALKYRKLARV